MSFVTKEWKDRLAEFAGRRKLTNVSTGEETTVDVSRAEGEVSQAGDAFSAANMNDLEQRIKDGFDKVDTNLTADGLQFKFSTDGEGNYGYLGADGSLIPFKSEAELALSTHWYYAPANNGKVDLNHTCNSDYFTYESGVWTAIKPCTIKIFMWCGLFWNDAQTITLYAYKNNKLIDGISVSSSYYKASDLKCFDVQFDSGDTIYFNLNGYKTQAVIYSVCAVV